MIQGIAGDVSRNVSALIFDRPYPSAIPPVGRPQSAERTHEQEFFRHESFFFESCDEIPQIQIVYKVEVAEIKRLGGAEIIYDIVPS